SAAAFFFLRQPIRLNAARPLANIGSAAGSGVAAVAPGGEKMLFVTKLSGALAVTPSGSTKTAVPVGKSRLCPKLELADAPGNTARAPALMNITRSTAVSSGTL